MRPRKLTGKYTNKFKDGWLQLKDFLLCILLLNTLIGNLQSLDITMLDGVSRSLSSTKVSVIQVAGKEAEASTLPQEEGMSYNANEYSVKTLQGEFSAYSIGDGFTPSDTMASRKKVYRGAIACPTKYKLGTKIKVESLGVFICEDRMAKRLREKEKFDIYMTTKSEAVEFGIKKLNYEIYEQ